MSDAFTAVVASLAAAISLLERGGKKAAPSDRMFDQMLADYRKALEDGREAIARSAGASAGATKVDFHDLETHLDAWKRAIGICRDLALPAGVDHDDGAYWQHELDVLCRVIPAAATRLATQANDALVAKVAELEAELEQEREANAHLSIELEKARDTDTGKLVDIIERAQPLIAAHWTEWHRDAVASLAAQPDAANTCHTPGANWTTHVHLRADGSAVLSLLVECPSTLRADEIDRLRDVIHDELSPILGRLFQAKPILNEGFEGLMEDFRKDFPEHPLAQPSKREVDNGDA